MVRTEHNNSSNNNNYIQCAQFDLYQFSLRKLKTIINFKDFRSYFAATNLKKTTKPKWFCWMWYFYPRCIENIPELRFTNAPKIDSPTNSQFISISTSQNIFKRILFVRNERIDHIYILGVYEMEVAGKKLKGVTSEIEIKYAFAEF